jgi:hypothetical protein
MNESFYENFYLFLDIVIKNSIQNGNDSYKFIMPIKMDNDDVVMWNSQI